MEEYNIQKILMLIRQQDLAVSELYNDKPQ